MKNLSQRNKYLVFGIALIIFALFVRSLFFINLILLVSGILMIIKGLRIKKESSTEELNQPELAKKGFKAEKGSSSDPQDKPLAINCPSCKAQNTPENSFCTSCGAEL